MVNSKICTLIFKYTKKTFMSSPKIVTSQPLFVNNFILRRARVANFADIMKTAAMLIKTTFKNSKKFKRIRIFCTKIQSIFVFLEITKIADFC